MKKLRLIKPWHLRIVAQKLNVDIRSAESCMMDTIPCQAPSGSGVLRFPHFDLYMRGLAANDSAVAYNKAPHVVSTKINSSFKIIR